MRRITADLDFKDKRRLINSLINSIFLIPKILELKIVKSNSKGYHLIIWTEKNINLEKIYKLREKIGDDKMRIKVDKLKSIGNQTLFSKKFYYKGVKIK